MSSYLSDASRASAAGQHLRSASRCSPGDFLPSIPAASNHLVDVAHAVRERPDRVAERALGLAVVEARARGQHRQRLVGVERLLPHHAPATPNSGTPTRANQIGATSRGGFTPVIAIGDSPDVAHVHRVPRQQVVLAVLAAGLRGQHAGHHVAHVDEVRTPRRSGSAATAGTAAGTSGPCATVRSRHGPDHARGCTITRVEAATITSRSARSPAAFERS